VSVSPARALAYEAVRATFERDAHTERFFREAADREGLDGRERGQAQRLAYGAVQRRGTADAAIERLAERSPRLLDPPVLAALRLGLYELLFADATPDHAAVDQAVELVKAARVGHAAGLVNAVLRRAGREREALSSDLLSDDSTPERAAVAHSAPLWLARMWWEELGPDSARSLLAACNVPAETAFRVNAPHTPARSLLSLPEMVVVEGRIDREVLRRIAAGELIPQSRGSAAVVELLDPQPGEQVLDLCAGPGIKTGQIAARMGDRGEVISIERDPERAAEVAAQAERLGVRNVTVVEADATAPAMPAGFDRVLVDPPCSDLGALASRPDARWRKSPKGIARLATLQADVLANGLRLLRPGGTLVYSTCTISRREGEEQVAALERGASTGDLPGFAIDDLGALEPSLASTHDPRCLQIRPDRDRTTGFFVCRLRKDD
jgi:16S rRNA (cytosine967-C5)-methyltransferase